MPQQIIEQAEEQHGHETEPSQQVDLETGNRQYMEEGEDGGGSKEISGENELKDRLGENRREKDQ